MSQTIESEESWGVQLHHKAKIRSGLDADNGGQSKASLLVSPDLGDAEIHPGFITEDKFTMRFPGIRMSGVADSSTN